MKGKLSDEIRLLHILDAIRYIEIFSEDKTKDDLFNDPMYRFSVERQLEIIGEAAGNHSEALKNKHSEIPWPKIISFRNFIVPEYFGLDLELVWDVVANLIPQLKNDVEKILEAISKVVNKNNATKAQRHKVLMDRFCDT
jgi:uncharacterized protein with HEPN domain